MSILTISDTHGFLDATRKALESEGLLEDKNNKVALLGDILDRGPDAVALTSYLVNLLNEDRLILIRGNHEELFEDSLADIRRGRIWEVATASHHVVNGTFDSIIQLAGMTPSEAVKYPSELVSRVEESDYYKILLPACRDYYETDKYILVHGHIPCKIEGYGMEQKYYYDPDWRNASPQQWRRARWLNGMSLAHDYGIVEKGKTIVVGHWKAVYGHAWIDNSCSEYGPDADFSPYYGDGIIAIDACTVRTGMVNCIRLDD
ncbi:MAG: metallophosphoesterase [Clostridia bacterium]|nr:metallophosphoesterase [Clostridia bacterium]